MYFNRLLFLPYGKANVSYFEIQRISEMQRGSDGKYYCEVFLMRRFAGFENDSVRYFDEQTQIISIMFQKDEKDVWTEKLQGIRFGAGPYDRSQNRNYYHLCDILNDTSFSDDKFENLVFDETQFLGEANFVNGNFNDGIYFNKVTFNKAADFRMSIYPDVSVFYNVSFHGSTCFDNTLFSRPIAIKNCHFRKGVTFSEANFKKDADFSCDTFRRRTIFHTSNINREINFTNSCFFDELDFSSSIFTDSTRFVFNQTRLPRLINFSNIQKIPNEVNFITAKFENEEGYDNNTQKRHYINLYNDDISKFKIDYQHFRLCFFNDLLDEPAIKIRDTVTGNESRNLVNIDGEYILFDSSNTMNLTKYSTFRDYFSQVFPSVRYCYHRSFYTTLCFEFRKLFNFQPPSGDSISEIYIKRCIANGKIPQRLTNEEIASIYEKVLKNFEDQGQKESFQKLDIEYKDFKNGRFVLPHIWNCYGYHKEWIFYWAFWLLLFFTIVTFCCVNFLRTEVYEFNFIDEKIIKFPNSTFFRIVSRLWYSFVFTSVVFFLFSLKIENFKFKLKGTNILGTIYIIVIYATGIACLAYMANFVLQK